ncbi:hypothetical protein [Phenylobacterium sp.]|jgi:hypothetical protein|uniref:hypothetical protein n=1 Tax=Phenylobacterium sp. TaxID=1871053 RepID=UPI002F421017
MRRPRLAFLTAILVLPAAGAAAAQMMGPTTPMPSTATYGGGLDFQTAPSPQQRYNQKIIALRDKMQKTARADGGQLTAEHKAALQKELDGINRQFGVKAASAG